MFAHVFAVLEYCLPSSGNIYLVFWLKQTQLAAEDKDGVYDIDEDECQTGCDNNTSLCLSLGSPELKKPNREVFSPSVYIVFFSGFLSYLINSHLFEFGCWANTYSA